MIARIMTLNIHPSEKIIANLQLVRFGFISNQLCVCVSVSLVC